MEIQKITLEKIRIFNIWKFIILISIGAIIFSGYLITKETMEAKKECNLVAGEYELKITGHYCNEKKFIKFMNCKKIYGDVDCELIWDFEDSNKINVSEFLK